MLFNHSYGFDDVFGPPWDGGVLEVRVDAQSWSDAGYLIVGGARYGTSPIRGDYGNPLGGRLGFTGDSYGYVTTQLYIPNAQAVQLRFRLGADDSVDDYGWFIDDVRIYACVGPFLEVKSPNGGESLPAGSLQQIRWDGATSLDATLELSYTDGTTTVPIATLPASATSHPWRVPPTASATARIVIRALVGGDVESSDTSDADFAVTAAAPPPPPRLDLDVDGHPDLLWHNQATGELYAWFMNGLVVERGGFLTPARFADTRWQIRIRRTSTATAGATSCGTTRDRRALRLVPGRHRGRGRGPPHPGGVADVDWQSAGSPTSTPTARWTSSGTTAWPATSTCGSSTERW